MKSNAIVGATSRTKSGARKEQAASAMPGARKGNRSSAEEQPRDMDVRRMIETEAYFCAERRGFAAGAELDDWLHAEAEVGRMLAAGGQSAA
ncbi:MAG: hypothetical protein A2045_03840 [Rhodocyclales bacterium GWA2_65_20]|nr:MAG: hypothetical protein A2045_03840 [Rhodocyclales bacterium GWA2_65_20]